MKTATIYHDINRAVWSTAKQSSPVHRRNAAGDLVGGQVFDVGGDEPLVAVGVGDAGDAGAVELVGGLRAFGVASAIGLEWGNQPTDRTG